MILSWLNENYRAVMAVMSVFGAIGGWGSWFCVAWSHRNLRIQLENISNGNEP